MAGTEDVCTGSRSGAHHITRWIPELGMISPGPEEHFPGREQMSMNRLTRPGHYRRPLADRGRILRQRGRGSTKIHCNYGNKSAKTGFETLAL